MRMLTKPPKARARRHRAENVLQGAWPLGRTARWKRIAAWLGAICPYRQSHHGSTLVQRPHREVTVGGAAMTEERYVRSGVLGLVADDSFVRPRMLKWGADVARPARPGASLAPEPAVA